jgi:hypothetical protein
MYTRLVYLVSFAPPAPTRIQAMTRIRTRMQAMTRIRTRMQAMLCRLSADDAHRYPMNPLNPDIHPRDDYLLSILLNSVQRERERERRGRESRG